MATFENTAQVLSIQYYKSCRCYCPLGKAWYTNNFTIDIEPADRLIDYLDIDAFIAEEIEGKELIIEDAAAKLKAYIKAAIDPVSVEVTTDVTDAGHGDVTVTV